MRVLVLVAHPSLRDQSKVNWRCYKAIRKISKSNPQVEIRDLYQLYPDFKIDIAVEQAALRKADRVVFQFPVHWYTTPALVNKYLTDVFSYGFSHGPGGNALHGKSFQVVVSAGIPNYGRGTINHYELEDFLLPLRMSAWRTGFRYLEPVAIYGTHQATDEAVEEFVCTVVKRILSTEEKVVKTPHVMILPEAA